MPCQYTTISGLLTQTTPQPEDMRLDPSLNLTLEGSLGDLLATLGNTEEAREREYQVPEERPQGTREASREEAIAST